MEKINPYDPCPLCAQGCCKPAVADEWNEIVDKLDDDIPVIAYFSGASDAKDEIKRLRAMCDELYKAGCKFMEDSRDHAKLSEALTKYEDEFQTDED